MAKVGSIDFGRYLGVDYNPDGQEKKSSALEKYQYRMKDREVMDIEFSASDPTGNFYVYDENDVKIVMNNEEVTGQKYEERHRGWRLRQKYAVVVISIDEENCTVYVSHAKAKENDKLKLINGLDMMLEKGERIILPAKVVDILPHRIIVDLGGLGVLGYLRIKEWNISFTSDLRKVATRNDIINVAVIKKGVSDEIKGRFVKWIEGMVAYECSRRDAMDKSPWDGIEEKYPRNTVVRLTCVEKHTKYFFGKINGLNDIEVISDYPNRVEPGTSKKIVVHEGAEYEGYVVKVDSERELFRVRIFKQISGFDLNE